MKVKRCEMSSQLAVPLEGCLLEAINRAAQVPNSARGKLPRKARGALHEDALTKIALEERVGDVHGVDFVITTRGKIEESTDCGELGSGREGVEIVNTMALGEALGTVASLKQRELTRELFNTKDPLPLDNVDTRRGRGIDVRAVASESITLSNNGLEPLRRMGAMNSLLIGKWRGDGGILRRENARCEHPEGTDHVKVIESICISSSSGA